MIDGRDRRTVPSAIERLSAPGPFAPDKDELMLYGTFSEIDDAGFLWQAETSSDGGRTWAVTHQMRASRRQT
jgi:hypothetical protein